MKYHLVAILSFLSFLLIISCNNDDNGGTVPSEEVNIDSLIISWLDSANVTAVQDESGIYYFPDSTTLNPLATAVQPSDVLAIFYEISTLDSTVLFSYQETDGDSILLKQGVSAVFPTGLDVGLSFMREGERYHFILPPDVGYQDATLSSLDETGIIWLTIDLVAILSEEDVFDYEIALRDQYILDNDLNDTVSVTELIDTTFYMNDPDSIIRIDTTYVYDIDSVEYFPITGLAYKELTDNLPGPDPETGDTIILDYTASFMDDGQAFDTKSAFTVILGSSEPRFLIPGLEFGLSLMVPGENGLIMIPSSQAYRESARVIPSGIIPELIEKKVIPDYVEDVGPYEILIFDVRRLN